MQNNCLCTKSINNHGMDLCSTKKSDRTHPKHNTQKAWASLVTGNMDFSAHTASHNWFPDMQMILLDGKNAIGHAG